ncbi:hypothetical protein [Beijerinckia indica]|uniref:hypothetical protein n=1 Tax=Beijerinckia indica TaxID=533 RepID=UPI0011D0C1AB|nr:hypothetical protein [Beijerinckia indica]
MTNSQDPAPLSTETQGRDLFDRLLMEEYGVSLTHWAGLPSLSDQDCASLTRALEILVMQPIAESAPANPKSETGEDIKALRHWVYSDEKIANPGWENSWQWHLLAAIDNGTRDENGGMMTPSDPRLFLLRLRYGRGIFAALADYLDRVFCGRTGARQGDDSASALRQVPGLDSAAPAFLAGLAFLVDKLGRDDFCDYCADLG